MQPEERNKEQAGVTPAQEETGTCSNVTQASLLLRKKKEVRHFLFLGEQFHLAGKGNPAHLCIQSLCLASPEPQMTFRRGMWSRRHNMGILWFPQNGGINCIKPKALKKWKYRLIFFSCHACPEI